MPPIFKMARYTVRKEEYVIKEKVTSDGKNLIGWFYSLIDEKEEIKASSRHFPRFARRFWDRIAEGKKEGLKASDLSFLETSEDEKGLLLRIAEAELGLSSKNESGMVITDYTKKE